MGIRTALRLVQAAEQLNTAQIARPVSIRSPWSADTLAKVVYSDVFGLEYAPVTRAEAMSLPPVARARHLLAGTIGNLPLRAYRGADELADQPAWLYRTDGATPVQLRMVWTVDDLIFHGWSLWAVRRGETGRILDAVRVPHERWRFDDDGHVLVDEEEARAEDVVLFPGNHEGICSFGARTIRAARKLEETWAQRAGNPIPAVELHQTSDDQLTDAEIDGLLDSWRTARADPGGAVAYTPSSVEVRVHGQTQTELLVQGRNAAAIDLARLVGIPAAMIDASNVNSTLTYETLQGRSLEFVDYALSLYTTAVSNRLSADDCTPRGTRVAFDLSGLSAPIPPTTSGPPTLD